MTMSEILGRGVYSVPEAARFTGLKASTVGRWAFGYRGYEEIVDPDLPQLAGVRAVSFLTLMELYLMRRLQDEGIRAEKFRIAAEEVAKREGIEHPFAFERLGEFLWHDSNDFYVHDVADDSDWLQITGRNRHNRVLHLVVDPFLREVEFESEYVRRWFPAESGRMVVLDPAVRFGEPVVTGTRIPTANLADQVAAGDSPAVVADCYDLTVDQVLAAQGFEERLLRAA